MALKNPASHHRTIDASQLTHSSCARKPQVGWWLGQGQQKPMPFLASAGVRVRYSSMTMLLLLVMMQAPDMPTLVSLQFVVQVPYAFSS